MLKKTLIGRWVLIRLSLFAIIGLVACNDTNTMDAAKAIKIIDRQNEGNCVYVSLSPSDIRFNTNTRLYDPVTKTIRVNKVLDGFSILEGHADKDDLKQFHALEEEGLIKKVANHVNPTVDGGYVTDIENSPVEVLTHTEKGYQYQLTKLGKSYFSADLGSSLPRVCVGYQKVDKLIINDFIEGEKYTVSYNIKIIDRPYWLNSPNIKESIPNLELAIAKIEASNIETTIIKKDYGYLIEQ